MPGVTTDARRDHRVLRTTRRFDLYVASSAYAVIVIAQACWPLFTIAPSHDELPFWRTMVPLLVGFALTAAELLMVRWSLQVVRAGGAGLDRSTLVRWSVVVVPLLVLMAGTPAWAGERNAFVISLGAAWAAVSLSYSLRVAAAGAVGVAFIGGIYGTIVSGVTADLGVPASIMAGLFLGFPQGLWVAFVVLALWSSGWMLRVVTEVNRAGRLAAELAIAEERLRISRDLHDVFGRTLATVALKSELAENLARRGRVEQSADEMAAVRLLAGETSREIRGVIRGYREADLDRELAGAQGLLDSAGIRCEVSGRLPELSAEQTSTLAWVLREAVTNVIRHSHATRVSISFSGTDPITTIIENNGVSSHDARRFSGSGHGLINMAERLAQVGGSFDYQQALSSFRVTATLPAGSLPTGHHGAGR
jgi:two-component system sensor histidine kinase DesK